MALTRRCSIFSYIYSLYMYIVELLNKIQMLGMDDVTIEQHVHSNAEISTGLQIQIDMQNMNSQIPNQNQGHETSTTIAINQQADGVVGGMNSEASQLQPSQNETQAKDLKTGLTVAIWASEIAACGVIAVLAGFLGNQTTGSSHNFFFKASLISLCITFIFGSCILKEKNVDTLIV
ncbi:uncharacterized protein LOC131236104 [Magnolia sinica]|uniref:uncharacterized protein LOC131236104 n=1 Tax=Magnolia sinica TaxID=86752 RepID=UPI00265875ED|nr:uncharacterized protein LOC131236104 [Magnolia sinica]